MDTVNLNLMIQESNSNMYLLNAYYWKDNKKEMFIM